ncbi:unnamed protein product [Caenorhabditis auriculariae]|uniref:Sphingomyelin synthase-like domain-containing protein n=1 Tax=Caenorhabditis auriculariae TaxID=2777116 RepID=A0A8S1HCG9_9PELO|nr:unnamed protein product [Caenorhabditis auriculariae]
MSPKLEQERLLHGYEFASDDRMFEKEKNDGILPTTMGKPYQVRRWPTIAALLFVGLGWFLNEVSLAWIHERVPRNVDPLPDFWFSWFPEIRGAIRITEYIMMILIVNAFVIMIGHQHRWIVMRRTFFCIALSYCFRAFCITIFQVPVPSVNTYCAPKLNSSLDLVAGRVARMFWSAGIEQLRPRELCGDLIVSGHTLTIFTSFMCFKTYAPKKLKPLVYLYNLLAVMAIVAILMARKHYMIDVVLGYTVSTRIFMEYHSLATSFHENTMDKNLLSWSFWSWVVPFMERDAPPPHVFHNHIEWPSNCPKKIRRRIA